MKSFKTYDLWISVGLIFSFTILSIIDTPVLFAGYFIVGGWQVISMLVHAYNRCFTNRWGARYIYHWITFIAVVTMPGSFWALLYVAPFMALYYVYLCYNEVYVKMKRPLDLLK